MFFTAAVSFGTGVLFGVGPALYASRAELISALKDDAAQPAGARSAARFRNGLVMAQFALAMTLLVMAGLFIQSLRNIGRVDLGIRTDNVVTFRLSPETSGYEPGQSRILFARVEETLAAQPGVTGVTASSVALFAGQDWLNDVLVEGFELEPDTTPNSRFNAIAPGYFETLGIPLLAGRTFTEVDALDAPKVAVVNEAFARQFDLGRDAVGKRMARGGRGAPLDVEIVGLVADSGYANVRSPAPALHYIPSRQQAALGGLTFYVRSTSPPEGLLRAIPALMADLDPNLPVTDLRTLPRQVRNNVSRDRLISMLAAAFAVVATLLAAVGLYGTLAYTVSQRTREFGLRMALGANAARLRSMVLGQVGRMTLASVAVGLVAALGVGRVARSLLYEVDGAQPVVVAVAAVVLSVVVVGLAAAFVPAHRASRIDPMTALRHR